MYLPGPATRPFEVLRALKRIRCLESVTPLAVLEICRCVDIGGALSSQ